MKLKDITIGARVRWNDPCIGDYDEADREAVLATVWTVARIADGKRKAESDNDIILITSDNGGEAEVWPAELTVA